MEFLFPIRPMAMLPNLDDIRAAAERIRPFIHRTPVLTCAALDDMAGAQLFFKCENLQKGGAFKARGATNAIFSLTEEEAQRGVATHSSGNHAAALALAAKRRGIPAHVVMPRTAPTVKRSAVAASGANIIECEPTLEAREAALAIVLKETGAIFVPPYNDARVIAGQGTAMLELLEQAPDLDVVIAPVGGGGLLSGTAIAAKALKPGIKVFGAEPAAADDAYRSLQAGQILPSLNPQTIADGLRTSLGELTFAAIRAHADGILTVSEEGIIQAMRSLWERVKIVVEPSGAVPLAAALEHAPMFAGRRVGVILSGGNVDLDGLPWQRTGG
jgi:threonine dehydratase